MISAQDFKRDVMHWANELNIKPKEIHIRPMKKKWASCSSKGRLTFSFELLDQPRNERAKAIVHELLHLRYPNHGKMFQRMLKIYLSKIPK